MPDSVRRNEFANVAVGLWRGDNESLEFVGDSANYVYSFIESGKTRFLRLTSSCDRTKEQIEAELDFISYLHQGSVSAALPVSSVAGRFVEEITSTNDLLFACVFEQAEGKRFRYNSAESNKEHFRLRGRTLGQIHALSKTYLPSGNFRRFAWDADNLLLEVEKFLPKSEKIVWREYGALKERLREYPQLKQTYGLIHGDFGETNYRLQDSRLNIFDFDDCCYHWFVYDLAITIYPHGWRKEGLQLLDWLLEGYSEGMPLNVTPTDITLFCQWRLIYMFLVYARKWGFEHMSQQQAKWFAQKRENIARGYQWSV
ncbi:MAG: phosphotransferase [Acidobacteriota bacterium]|nr:phosphotransferase [Acidobacteriota bacterium]